MKPRANKPSKLFRQNILLFCEGETELNYLDGLKALRYKGSNIKILPELPKHTGYRHVFSSLSNILKRGLDSNYLSLFCLVDLDTVHYHNKLSEYETAKRKLLKTKGAANRLYVIESRPCVEFWFLLHFDPNDRLYVNCQEVETELCKHLNDYCKNQNYTAKLYDRLKGYLETAMNNSKKICCKPRQADEEFSYTFMHQLIELLDQAVLK